MFTRTVELWYTCTVELWYTPHRGTVLHRTRTEELWYTAPALRNAGRPEVTLTVECRPA